MKFHTFLLFLVFANIGKPPKIDDLPREPGDIQSAREKCSRHWNNTISVKLSVKNSIKVILVVVLTIVIVFIGTIT